MTGGGRMTERDTPVEPTEQVDDIEVVGAAAGEPGPEPGAAAADARAAASPAGVDAVLDEEALPEELPDAGRPLASSADDPVEAVRAERDEYLDALRRVQADFENYKKRVMRQQTEHLERAAEALVAKLLPVLDNLDLALAHMEPDSDHGRAVGQIGASLIDVLTRDGLERIEPLGRTFDPTEAEAVMHEPGGGGEPEVVEVLRPGYRWRGRVIRAAMVKVKG